jgi:integrase
MKKRADGRWQKKKVIDGKTVFFFSTAETEKQAIKDFENQMLAYSEANHKSSHNFKLLAEKALDQQAQTITYNTLQSYTYSMKYLEPFYDKNIEDIKPIMVQKLIDDMVLKKHYSFSAVSKAKIFFGIVLDYAIVNENLPLNNFARSIKIPKSAVKGKVKSPPSSLRAVIIDSAEKVEFGMWAMILLCTGLRRGELLALRKRDINFLTNEIFVNDAVEFIVNQPNLKGKPKTESSQNSIPILGLLKPSLERLCENLQPDEFLFGKEKPLTKTQIDKRWKKYCTAIGYNFNAHQLRHEFAKIIYEAGIDVKTAQRLLRHADFTTTMNIYTDFSETLTAEAVNKLNNFTQSVVRT